MMRCIFISMFFCCVAAYAQQLGDLIADSPKRDSKEAASKVSGGAEEIKAKAERGDPAAMLALGTYYASGKNGFERNPARALELVRASAQKGFAPAQVYLGYIYGEGKIVARDFKEAAKWREEGASNGGANDKWSLGNAYLYGYLLPKDQMKALYWITQAAQQNHIEAMLKLVEIYKNLNNQEQLNYWNKKLALIEIDAAESGNVLAMLSVAKKFMRGKDGFPRSGAQGVFWYKRAADSGNREALEYVAKMYASGRFLEKNPEKARELFEKVAEMDPGFGNDIALFYADGREIPPDPERARYWFEKSIKTGNDTNKLQLAFRYWTARGVPADIQRAKELCAEVAKSASGNRFSGEAKAAKAMLSDIENKVNPPENMAEYFRK